MDWLPSNLLQGSTYLESILQANASWHEHGSANILTEAQIKALESNGNRGMCVARQ